MLTITFVVLFQNFQDKQMKSNACIEMYYLMHDDELYCSQKFEKLPLVNGRTVNCYRGVLLCIYIYLLVPTEHTL